MADATVSAEVREILAKATEPMSCAEIFEKSELASTTTHIASSLSYDLNAGRVERTGDRGAYRYTLTAEGHKANNPKAARSIAEGAALGERPPKRRATKKATPAKRIAAARESDVIAATTQSIARAIRKCVAPSKKPSRGTERSTTSHATAAAAIVPNHSALQVDRVDTAHDVEHEQASRLAAAVIVHWPAPLASMPHDLRRLITMNIESLREAD